MKLNFTPKKNHLKSCLILIIAFLFQGCYVAKNPIGLTTFSKSGHVNCIVEIPAGTNKKIEFNKNTKKFKIDSLNGNERVIEYLPYPGNYGFIPSTNANAAQGGDGDPLDVLVLCESLPTDTHLEITPIAMLKLLDEGQADFKVIAIPANPELQTLTATSLIEFSKKYKQALTIIEIWFANYNPSDSVKILGWADEKETLNEILRLSTQQNLNK